MSGPRHEPLAHLGLLAGADIAGEAAAVTLRALPYCPSLILRGESDDAAFLAGCRAGLGFELPLAANHVTREGGLSALWLGPSEWLILGPQGGQRLTENLAGHRHALIPNGDGLQIIELSGPRAAAVLAKLCPLDLHGPEFGPGRCARSVLAGVTMTLWPGTDGGYRIIVGRSFADYAWRILADAGLEFDIAVGAADEKP
jgi:sarcosine oxidase subunit gamma